MTGKALSTFEIRQALKERYCPKSSRRVADKWAFVEEVRDGAGHQASRSCDAIAMGLWPSEGLRLHGHEIKASRSDWKKELDDPSKALAFSRYCHYWWIVATKGIVLLEELPSNWGLMTVGESLTVKVQRQATFNRKPDALSYGFVASLLRRSLEQDEIEAMVRRAKEEGIKEGYARAEQRHAELTARAKSQESVRKQDAVEAIKTFEEASGIRINSWDAGRFGEAVALIENLDPRIAVRQVSGLASAAARLAAALETIFPTVRDK